MTTPRKRQKVSETKKQKVSETKKKPVWPKIDSLRTLLETANPMIGSIFKAVARVYNELGPGRPEIHYQMAMAIEMKELGLTVDVEAEMTHTYKGMDLVRGKADLLVSSNLIIETKAAATMSACNQWMWQLNGYMVTKNVALGLMINFPKQFLGYIPVRALFQGKTIKDWISRVDEKKVADEKKEMPEIVEKKDVKGKEVKEVPENKENEEDDEDETEEKSESKIQDKALCDFLKTTNPDNWISLACNVTVNREPRHCLINVDSAPRASYFYETASSLA